MDLRPPAVEISRFYLEAYENFSRKKRQGNALGCGEEWSAIDARIISHRWGWSVGGRAGGIF